MNVTLMKNVQRSVGVSPDGLIGSRTIKAIANALGCSDNVKSVQVAVGVADDGRFGPATLAAVAGSLGVAIPQLYPVETESELMKFYGEAGSNLAVYDLPYTLYMDGVACKRITLNIRCSSSFLTLFERLKEHYGMEQIKKLGLDQYGGAYCKRRITGGSRWSTHAYGCAIDLDPEHNAMNMHAPKARFSGEEYDYLWLVCDELGLQSLGKAKDFDWMHIQACWRV